MKATTISREELNGLRVKLDNQKLMSTIKECVDSIKQDVINLAADGYQSYLWKNTRLLICRHFNLQDCEISDKFCDQVGDEVIVQLRKIFTDCSVDRVIGRTFFGRTISDSIRVSWG